MSVELRIFLFAAPQFAPATRRRALPLEGICVAAPFVRFPKEDKMSILRKLWLDDQGQDIAEYAVMLAVILVIVVGTIRLIGGNANNVFSEVASSISQ